jgi:hypothetical protein
MMSRARDMHPLKISATTLGVALSAQVGQHG